MNRRSFVSASLAVPAVAAAGSAPAAAEAHALRCRTGGDFRILAISDLHYRPVADPHGIALAERLIDLEKPGLVIVNGDCLSGKDCKDAAGLRTAIGHVASAMERKRVPWAITFGNHDQEHLPYTGLDKHAVLAMYAGYPHNLNAGYERGLSGAEIGRASCWVRV